MAFKEQSGGCFVPEAHSVCVQMELLEVRRMQEEEEKRRQPPPTEAQPGDAAAQHRSACVDSLKRGKLVHTRRKFMMSSRQTVVL